MSTSFFDEIPAGPPPPGVQPNFTNPTTRNFALIVFNAIFISLMTVVVFIRFYVRIFLTRSIGWDDYTCGIAAILSWVQAASVLRIASFGYGAHLWDIPASALMSTSNVRWTSAVVVVYPAITGMIKVSILLLFYRIFTVSKIFRNIIIGSIVCITLISILFTVLDIFVMMDCVNLVDLDTNPICGSGNTSIVLALGIFAVVTDFWLLFLPMRSIFGLQLRNRRKIGVIAIFSTGAITCLLSLTRVIYYSKTYNSTDPLWTAVPSLILMIIEINVGIIVACSSTLGKFYRRVKELTSSVYQSLRNRTFQHDSSAEKSKSFSLENDDGSEMRLNEIKESRSNSGTPYYPAIGLNDEVTYQIAEPAHRTDSHEVA